jgi:5'-nucleotidase
MGYKVQIDFDTLEPNSDIYAFVVDRVISVTPLSIDLTSRVDFDEFCSLLRKRLPELPS